MAKDVHDKLESYVCDTPQRRDEAERRLRVFAGNFALPNLLDSCARYMREDKADIARLRAENERLRGERDEARQLKVPATTDQLLRLEMEVSCLRAEIERLRAALKNADECIKVLQDTCDSLRAAAFEEAAKIADHVAECYVDVDNGFRSGKTIASRIRERAKISSPEDGETTASPDAK